MFRPTMIIALCLVLAGIATAGDLTPPPGAPAPTMKTLQQVEPRTPIDSLPLTITTPGSYYVTGDLSGPGGILVQASNVTIDLNGYTLTGGTGTGIDIVASATNVEIRNGSLTGWGSEAIGSSVSNGIRVFDVHVDCAGTGFHGILLGTDSTVEDSSATDCTFAAIQLGTEGTIRRSSGSHSAAGIVAGSNAVVEACTARLNDTGFDLFVGSRIEDSFAELNDGHGIDVASRSIVRNNFAKQNTDSGIRVILDTLVVGNLVIGNAEGINVSSQGNRIERNHSAANSVGFLITGNANTIVGNSSGNDSLGYDIGGNNPNAGPIQPASTATSPFANFD